jgi:hypothetical protein
MFFDLDDLIAMPMPIGEQVCEGWNIACTTRPCGEEQLTVDLGSPAMIDGLAFWSIGDGVHDAKNMSLQAGHNLTSPFRAVASFSGVANRSTVQVFGFPATFAQYFRLLIHTRYTHNQACVREIQLRAAVSAPEGYLPNHATNANDSIVVSSTGAEAGCDAWKIADGRVVFRSVSEPSINKLVGEGWNAQGTDGHGANYVIFDLGKRIHIVGLAFYSIGDRIHDPGLCHIQTTSLSWKDGNWTTVASFHGEAGYPGLQEFPTFSFVGRYWRFYIANTHVPRYHQAIVKEVYFKPSPSNLEIPSGDLSVATGVELLEAPEIAVYYQPYHIGSSAEQNNVSYARGGTGTGPVRPSGMSAASIEEFERWQRDVRAQLELAPKSIPTLSSASMVYEARGPSYGKFNAYTDMERVATESEVAIMLAQHPADAVLAFTEPRERTIRMRDRVPFSWILSGPSSENKTVHLGTASKNEYFVFQVGLYAARANIQSVTAQFSDMHGAQAGVIEKERLSSPNLGGVDSNGNAFNRTIDVKQGEVGVLWVSVDISKDTVAQAYQGSVTLFVLIEKEAGVSDSRFIEELEMSLSFSMELSPAVLHDRGDSSDGDKMSRLRWLDSTLGLDSRPAKRFSALQLDRPRQCISTWGADVTIDDYGLPSQIRHKRVTIEGTGGMLTRPISLHILRGNTRLQMKPGKLQIGDENADSIAWTSAISTLTNELDVSTAAHMEADGHMMFNISILYTGSQKMRVDDVRLEIPLRKAAVPYFMGLSKPGGYRPSNWSWSWSADRSSRVGQLRGQNPAMGGGTGLANHQLWIGDVDQGLHLKLRGDGSEWTLPGYQVYDAVDVPHSWAGDIRENITRTAFGQFLHNLTLFHGGINVTEDGDQVLLSTYSGGHTLVPNARLSFVFELQLTPCQPLDTAAQFRQRYAQIAGMWVPTTLPEIREYIAGLWAAGIRTFNIHQGASTNRYINWPLANTSMAPLALFAEEIHRLGGRVKMYYTNNELSTRVDIMWPLRSLGAEVIDDWATMSRPRPGPDGPGGMSWLQEHLRSGYVPCWDTPLGNDTFDTAVCTNDAAARNSLQSKHRLNNYYVEGVNSLMASWPWIDGCYLDGIAFDRKTAKRVRKVMDDAADYRSVEALTDLHGGNGFADACSMLPDGTDSTLQRGSVSCPHPKTWACEGGCVSPALQFLDHMPYLDRALFGEGFSYDTPHDYWLVEISALPFGLMGEMLGGSHPANAWRGMLYGMVWRYGPAHGANKTAIWEVWDRFGIVDSEMLGYWNASCPARTNCSDVLATVYLRHAQRALISVASWAKADVGCTLQIDWAALGFAAKMIYAPPIDGFQLGTSLRVTDTFDVPQGRGLLLWLEAENLTLVEGANRTRSRPEIELNKFGIDASRRRPH